MICLMTVLLGAAPATRPARTTTPASAPAAEMPRYGAWQASRIGGGGYVQNVVLSASNPLRCYTYLDVGGPYRSDDGGLRWRSLQGGLPGRRGNYSVRSLLVDPRDENQLIIATGSQWEAKEGVYISENGGQTWRRTLEASFQSDVFRNTGRVLARHPTAPDIVLAGAIGTGIWRSADGGRNWEKIGPEGVNPTDVRFDRERRERCWLCASAMEDFVNGQRMKVEGGLYRSDDTGRTWKKIGQIAPLEMLQDPKDAGRLYGIFDRTIIRTSVDGGENWRDFSEGLPIEPSRATLVSESRFTAMAAGTDFVLAGSTRGTIYRLGSAEDRWKKVEREGIEEGEWFGRITPGSFQHFGAGLSSIVVDPQEDNRWLITDWYALYQSHDAGKHWRLTIDGIEGTFIHQLLQDPTDPGLVHLAMADNGYFRSFDGGKTFSRVRMPNDCANVKDLALSPKLPSRIYAVGSDGSEWRSNQAYVSIDRGQTWHVSPMVGLPDMSRSRCNSIAASPDDPYHVYLAVSGLVRDGEGGPYQSVDGGRTWKWIGKGLPEGQRFYRQEVWSTGREIAAGSGGSLITVSQDRGEAYRFDAAAGAWVKMDLTPGGKPFSVVADVLQRGHFYLGGDEGIFLTKDNGAEWKRVYSRAVTHIGVDLAVAGRAAASTSDGVILTRDAGQGWAMLDKSLPDRVRYNMPAFAGERLVVGSGGSGAFWMPLSREGEKPVKSRTATSLPSTRPTSAPAIFPER